MTLADKSSTRFSDLEPEQLGDYRPLNRLALVSLILGLLSSLALIHPVFFLVPVLAFLCSILALRQMPAGDQRQSGRALAILGICFSLLFVSWGVGREISRQRYMFRHARHFAEEWLELFRQGKYYEAHQLSMMESRRLEPGESLEKHYAPPPTPDMAEIDRKRKESDPSSPEMMSDMMKMMEPSAADEFKAFADRDMIKRLQQLGPKVTFVFRSNVAILKTGPASERVDQLFEARSEVDGQPKSILFKVQLERNFQTGLGDWRMLDVIAPGA